MEEEKAAIEKLQNEITKLRKSFRKIDPKKKDKLKEEIAALEKRKIAFWLKTRSRAKWWPTSKKRKRR